MRCEATETLPGSGENDVKKFFVLPFCCALAFGSFQFGHDSIWLHVRVRCHVLPFPPCDLHAGYASLVCKCDIASEWDVFDLLASVRPFWFCASLIASCACVENGIQTSNFPDCRHSLCCYRSTIELNFPPWMPSVENLPKNADANIELTVDYSHFYEELSWFSIWFRWI